MIAILEKAGKIISQPVCDNCLGRQFSQLLSGMSNKERGQMIKAVSAMSLDKEGSEITNSNFSDIKFHYSAVSGKEERCSVCFGFFNDLEKWVSRIEKKVKDIEFGTFLVGTKLSSELAQAEEDLWERVGIDYCEPLKAEINREIGKLLERTGKKCNLKKPDINILLDISGKKVSVDINPIFIYGEYQKLIRGIPQTKWPSGKYKTSVEQIIAKPFMSSLKGNGHKFHGLGREDIDARCLAWRPFVLEILNPVKRKIDFNLYKKIKPSVKVRNLRLSDIAEVRKIKETRIDKTYSALVECPDISKKDLVRISSLKGIIKQRTPQRVMHRRSDLLRKRAVKEIKPAFISKKRFRLVVTGEAGLYIKELISGDNGRTDPSVSSVLGKECKCIELDVIKIHT